MSFLTKLYQKLFYYQIEVEPGIFVLVSKKAAEAYFACIEDIEE